MQQEMVKSHDLAADILIEPPLSVYQPMKFEKQSTKEMIDLGEQEARTKLPQILEQIESWPE